MCTVTAYIRGKVDFPGPALSVSDCGREADLLLNVRREAQLLLVLCSLLVASCSVSAAPTLARAARRAHSRTAVPAGPEHPHESGSIRVTLPVRRLPTTFGVDYVVRVPRSVKVTIPAAWQGEIGAYWSGTVLLGPAGWTGKGLYGADGSGGVQLYPPGGSAASGARMLVEIDGACMGCGAVPAGAYFAYVRRNWSRFEVVPGPAPTPVKVLSEVYRSPNLIAYRLPDTKDGLEVKGLAYSGLVNDASSIPFESMTVYLPKPDHALATAILDFFEEQALRHLP